MKCTEPPVRCPRSPDRPKHSAMTPCPAKAASPEMSSGITIVRSSRVAPSWSCFARTLPSTTGLTISRCDGLAVSERCTRLPSNSRSEEAPRWDFTSPEPSTSFGVEEPPLNSWKMARCGLAPPLANTVERPPVGHADDDVLHAERASALDDLLESGNHRFGAVETEALGASELQIAEFLEAFGLDQLVEDRALAFAGERDFLVRPLDARLDPTLLRGVGDVHELDAERLAIGAAKDRENFAQRAEFEAEHAVEKDLAVVVRFGEAVGARIEILLVMVRLETERVEIGVEVPARAIGANQHQGVDRI